MALLWPCHQVSTLSSLIPTPGHHGHPGHLAQEAVGRIVSRQGGESVSPPPGVRATVMLGECVPYQIVQQMLSPSEMNSASSSTMYHIMEIIMHGEVSSRQTLPVVLIVKLRSPQTLSIGLTSELLMGPSVGRTH